MEGFDKVLIGRDLLANTCKRKNLLSLYFTAGFPKKDDTAGILLGAQEAGVDFIEIGFPFSDPIADGPVIQESSAIALQNGMNLHLLFEQLISIRHEIRMPLILMGYLNPVLQYGIIDFCRDCRSVGVSGIILPDLPMEEYEKEYKMIFDLYDLSCIFLITPQTSDERIHKIDSISNSFIYAVSSSSTTGAKNTVHEGQLEYLKRVQNMKLKNPVVVGFGISNYDTYSQVIPYVNGAIIGSAFISFLKQNSISGQSIYEFVQRIIKG